MGLVALFVSSVLVNNILLARFLGCCPFLGVSSQLETAKGMGVAVVFVTTFAAIMTWLAYNFILVPLGLEYLYTLAFILIIAALVQFVETVLKKMMPGLYKSLGIFLPLITTNCAVLGVAVINMNENYNFIYSVVNAFGSSAGFLLAIVPHGRHTRENRDEHGNAALHARAADSPRHGGPHVDSLHGLQRPHQIGGTDMEGILYPTLVMGGARRHIRGAARLRIREILRRRRRTPEQNTRNPARRQLRRLRLPRLRRIRRSLRQRRGAAQQMRRGRAPTSPRK